MKSHPTKEWPRWAGFNRGQRPDRIEDTQLVTLDNGICDFTGRVVKPGGFYPVSALINLSTYSQAGSAKVHTLARFRAKNNIQRVLAIVGSGMWKSPRSSLWTAWRPVTFPSGITTPALNRAAAIVFRNNYAYHQNGSDVPFRVEMETDDGSTPSSRAEILGLIPPTYAAKDIAPGSGGTRFPQTSYTAYAVTYVYGTRGESGPSPVASIQASTALTGFTLEELPIAPSGWGVTARRIYRTQIGRGKVTPTTLSAYQGSRLIDTAHESSEFFLVSEINDNTTTTFYDDKDDAGLDFTRRCPPARHIPPRAKYQVMHQDRIFWGNLREHPWVAFCSSQDQLNGAYTINSCTLTVDNTGNGTITITIDTTPNTYDGTCVVNNYKQLTLREIQYQIAFAIATMTTTAGTNTGSTVPVGASKAGVVCFRIVPGVDPERTYVFAPVTNQNIMGSENVHIFEAIDGDAVAVDGCERFPNRVKFSDVTFPEEVNPFNSFDVSRNDAYPITGLFKDDYLLGVMTQNDIWMVTGDFITNPETFVPEFNVARSQSEHGNICTRPDSIVQTPSGFIFVGLDGLRIFRGQNSERFAREVDPVILSRLLREPRARDSLAMHYESGCLRIAYAGEGTA